MSDYFALPAAFVDIESAIKSGSKAISWIERRVFHERCRSIAAPVQQVRKIREFRPQWSAQFTGAVRLRISASKNRGMGNYSQRRLCIGMFEDDALPGKRIETGGGVFRIQKSYAVGANGIQRYRMMFGLAAAKESTGRAKIAIVKVRKKRKSRSIVR